MPYVIGIDEAGFGPNLGPLVISATRWHLPQQLSPDDLYAALAGAVAPAPVAADDRIAIADSKILYRSGQGLRLLERALFASLTVTGRAAGDWGQLWDVLDADREGTRFQLPWYRDYQLDLPVAADVNELDALAARLRGGLAQAGVRLEAIRSQAIFPEPWNALVDRCGTKGAALSQASFDIMADVLAQVGNQPVMVICDKHGGRNHYGHLLQQRFPDWLVEVREECRARSVYAWGPAEARVQVQFCASAEAFLPVALASVACKYLRELAMRAENDFWCGYVQSLKRTAGYPADARRFKTEISQRQRELGIHDRLVWRVR
jgi:ribonuclease HII